MEGQQDDCKVLAGKIEVQSCRLCVTALRESGSPPTRGRRDSNLRNGDIAIVLRGRKGRRACPGGCCYTPHAKRRFRAGPTSGGGSGDTFMLIDGKGLGRGRCATFGADRTGGGPGVERDARIPGTGLPDPTGSGPGVLCPGPAGGGGPERPGGYPGGRPNHQGRARLRLRRPVAGPGLRFGFKRLFDTQIAARFLGSNTPNLGSVLESFLGVAIRKSRELQRSDWALRPLSASALEYASNDVQHLIRLAQTLRERLRELERLDGWRRSASD